MADHDDDPFAEGRRYPPTVETEGPWEVTFNWEVADGRIECREIHIRAVEPGVSANAGLWDDLRMGERIRRQRTELTSQALAAAPPRTPGGMRRSTRERLEEAATVYRNALRAEQRPTKAVAEHFGLTTGGASSLVARAREAGLLPPTSPGAPQA